MILFELKTKGGKIINDNWSDISTQKLVKYQDSNKIVYVCNLEVEKIKIKLKDLETEMVVPEGCDVYFAKKAQISSLQKEETFVGLIAGLIKDGEVVEERFINNIAHEIMGFRK
jgi:hypothetical protein